MPDKIIINTENEDNALIPDKWVVGKGLSTNSLYITHTDAPLMIVQCPFETEDGQENAPPYTVYVKGEIKPDMLNQLFAEAWELIGIYKGRFNSPETGTKDFPKSVT